MVRCAALYCKSDSRHLKNIRFYTFPSELVRRRKWELVCRRANWHATKFAKLCQKHFEENQYEQKRKDGWKKLKPNAIPTITDVTVSIVRINPLKQSFQLKKEVADPEQEIENSELECRHDDANEISTKVIKQELIDMNETVKQLNSEQLQDEESQFERHGQDTRKKRKVYVLPRFCRSQHLNGRRVKAIKRLNSLDPDLIKEVVKTEPPDYNDGERQDNELAASDLSGMLDEDQEYLGHSADTEKKQVRPKMSAMRLDRLKSGATSNRKQLFDISRVQTPSSDMERRMTDEEENLMKEWDRTVKFRKEDQFSIRPVSLASDDSTRTGGTRNVRGSSGKAPSLADLTSSGALRFEFPEVDVVKRHDTSLDSTEFVEDDSRRFTYVNCPSTGHKIMRMELDVEGFEPKDITVKSFGGRLTVHGIRCETVNSKQQTNEFCRKIKLPDEVASESLRCTFSDQVLTLEAPVKSAAQCMNSGSPSQEQIKHVLNRPVIMSDENGRYVSLVVELGRIFKPCDVVVKVRGEQTVCVLAEAVENADISRMKAKLEWEFDLPEKIDRKSLKAGCTEDRLLKIVARIRDFDEYSESLKSVRTDSSNDF